MGWRKGRRRGGAEAARGKAEVEAEAAVPTTRSASHLGRLLRRRSFAFSMSSYPKWVSVLGTLLEAVSGNPNDCAQPKMHMGSVIGDSLTIQTPLGVMGIGYGKGITHLPVLPVPKILHEGKGEK